MSAGSSPLTGSVTGYATRASPHEVGLSRGGRSGKWRVIELGPEESVPVLRQYLREVPVTRAYFDVTPDSADEEFAAEAPRHPVFRLVPFA